MPNQMIRSRNGGRTFELRITHRALPKPVYRTFNSEAEARRAGQGALAALSRGEVPEWLQQADKNPIPTVAAAIRAYLAARSVPASTQAVLDTVVNQIGKVRIEDVTYRWAENWIETIKLESRVSPGTIRKKVGALRRAFAWLIKSHPQSLASNPLDDLDHGYSSYNDRIRQALQAAGHDVPHDVERDRRVSADEERAVVAALVGFKDQAVSAAERAHWEGLELMFLLALRTAMRMREIYTLTRDQVDIDQKTIRLRRTKSGSRRIVPLNSHACEILSREWPALREVCGDRHLLPFWQGDLDPKHLTDLTSKLSKDFAKAVASAGVDDLHFHDTRHEAVCRWVLNAPQPLVPEVLGRAAGMTDQRTRMRYLSLSGAEIADRLG
jgi:integrase